MKTYAVRKELRTPVHCQFYCVTDDTFDTLLDGIVWDLSEIGGRVTVERPVPVGLESLFLSPYMKGRTAITS